MKTIETKIGASGAVTVKIDGKRAKFDDAKKIIAETMFGGDTVEIIAHGKRLDDEKYYTGGFNHEKSCYVFTDREGNEYSFCFADYGLTQFAKGQFNIAVTVTPKTAEPAELDASEYDVSTEAFAIAVDAEIALANGTGTFGKVKDLCKDMLNFDFGSYVNADMHATCRLIINLINSLEDNELNGFYWAGYQFKDSYESAWANVMSYLADTLKYKGVDEKAEIGAVWTHDLNSCHFNRRGLAHFINKFITDSENTRHFACYLNGRAIADYIIPITYEIISADPLHELDACEYAVSAGALAVAIIAETHNAEQAAGNYELFINGEYVRFVNHSIVYIDAERKLGLNFRRENGKKNFYSVTMSGNYRIAGSEKKIAAKKIADLYQAHEQAIMQNTLYHQFFDAHETKGSAFFAVKFYIDYADGSEHIFARYFDRYADAKNLVNQFNAKFGGNSNTTIYILRDKQGGEWLYRQHQNGYKLEIDIKAYFLADDHNRSVKTYDDDNVWELIPKIDELNDVEFDSERTVNDLDDSLIRAEIIALENFQAFCKVGNLSAANRELELFNICRNADRQLINIDKSILSLNTDAPSGWAIQHNRTDLGKFIVTFNHNTVASLDSLVLQKFLSPEQFFQQFKPLVDKNYSPRQQFIDDRQQELNDLLEMRKELVDDKERLKSIDALIEQVKRDLVKVEFRESPSKK